MTLFELRALPVGTLVRTGGGLVYLKVARTRFQGPAPLPGIVPAAWLLDPDHSQQPIEVVS